MAQSLVRSQSPEECEYVRYQTEIEIRKRRVADLEVELETVMSSLSSFEAEYHARVGRLFVDLDQVRLAIDEYEWRIARLRADPGTDPAKVEAAVRGEFAGRRAETDSDAEETRRYEQEFAREQTRPRLNHGDEDALARLYRELARRFHPDLARTEEERQLREPFMQRVNTAFRDRDLNSLFTLAKEAEVDDPAFASRSIGEKLIWAIREVARLDEMAADLEGKIKTLQTSDSYALWQRQQAGEGVVEQLEAELTAEIVQEREKVAVLIATYRQLLDRHRT